ncbi:MAG: hypothetical protein ACOYKM_10865 [Caulobacterales bacterium]
MSRLLRLFAIAVLCLSAQACRSAPGELAGLWASGPGACEANAGILFAADAVRIQLGGRTEVLLADPHYRLRPNGDILEVTIDYRTRGRDPRLRGEVVLVRGADGWLHVRAHRHGDVLTGSSRTRLPEADPLTRALNVRQCGANAWIEGLRGRPAA